MSLDSRMFPGLLLGISGPNGSEERAAWEEFVIEEQESWGLVLSLVLALLVV